MNKNLTEDSIFSIEIEIEIEELSIVHQRHNAYENYLHGIGVKSIPVPITKKQDNENKLHDKFPIHLRSEEDKKDIVAVEEILKGNTKSFSVLHKRYYLRIKNTYYFSLNKNTADAEDLTMDLFEKLFKNLHKYDSNRFTFNAWITRVASNHLIDHWRKKKLETISIDIIAEDGVNSDNTPSERNSISNMLMDKSLNPHDYLEKKQLQEYVMFYLSMLEEGESMIIKKLFIDGKTYVEISTEMELPLGTIKAQIFRAKAKLKNLILNSHHKHLLEYI
jgi:RNA polymerase sigma-70 factor (ECF subfamily)